MGMNRGWVSPTVPFGAIGLQDYALCFWSAHATLFSWLFRFAASALGYAAGQWIGSNTDSATLAALASSQQVPTILRTLARYYPDYTCGVLGAEHRDESHPAVAVRSARGAVGPSACNAC